MCSRPELTVFLIGSRDMRERLELVLRPMKVVSELITVDKDLPDTLANRAAPWENIHGSCRSNHVDSVLIVTDTALSRHELLDLCKSRSKGCLDHRQVAILRIGAASEDGIQVSRNCDSNDLRVIVALLAKNLRLKRSLHKKRFLMKSLQSIAVRDPLTGLANRRGWNVGVKRLWNEAFENAGFLMVALFDLDGFKAINDQLGHAFGDQVLQSVSQKMRSACRKGDLLARWGGDEIALAVVLSEKAAAQRLVDRVRRQLESCFPELGQPVTACAGYVVVRPTSGWTTGQSERLLGAADVALSKAKASRKSGISVENVDFNDLQENNTP